MEEAEIDSQNLIQFQELSNFQQDNKFSNFVPFTNRLSTDFKYEKAENHLRNLKNVQFLTRRVAAIEIGEILVISDLSRRVFSPLLHFVHFPANATDIELSRTLGFTTGAAQLLNRLANKRKRVHRLAMECVSVQF